MDTALPHSDTSTRATTPTRASPGRRRPLACFRRTTSLPSPAEAPQAPRKGRGRRFRRRSVAPFAKGSALVSYGPTTMPVADFLPRPGDRKSATQSKAPTSSMRPASRPGNRSSPVLSDPTETATRPPTARPSTGASISELTRNSAIAVATTGSPPTLPG